MPRGSGAQGDFVDAPSSIFDTVSKVDTPANKKSRRGEEAGPGQNVSQPGPLNRSSPLADTEWTPGAYPGRSR